MKEPKTTVVLEEATVLDDNIEELESFVADEVELIGAVTEDESEEEMEDRADELDGFVIDEFDDSNELEDFATDDA